MGADVRDLNEDNFLIPITFLRDDAVKTRETALTEEAA